MKRKNKQNGTRSWNISTNPAVRNGKYEVLTSLTFDRKNGVEKKENVHK